MDVYCLKFGEVVVDRVQKKEEFIDLLGYLDLKTPVLIKPNWGMSVCFTEAEVLDWTLEAVKGEALVVESYGWARTKAMVEEGKYGSRKKRDLRKSDEWFLEWSGVGKILKKHGVEFLNLSEEYWGERNKDPQQIQKEVEARFSPTMLSEMYEFIPQRLYDMKGCDLLSLAKVRAGMGDIGASLAVKNFFGMIPFPSRWKYHGKKNCDLSQNICDINKVYHTFFDVKGVTESIRTGTKLNPETKKDEVIKDSGFAAVSKNILDLDAVVATMLGKNPEEIPHLKEAQILFNGWDVHSVREAAESGMTVF
jgi:uncharacterized protein (DUF362 family)